MWLCEECVIVHLRVVFWVGGECLCGEVEKNKTGKHTQKKKTMGKKEWEESVVLVFSVGGHR